MRIGILGGSFDPIHYGHLLLAEVCLEQLSLDTVWFIPAATAPHKSDAVGASAEQRREMVELAIAGHPAFECSAMEIDRGGLSYTVDTLSQIATEHPEATLYLLMGADSLSDLPLWRDPEQICQLAIPAVAARPGQAAVDFKQLEAIATAERLEQARQAVVSMPQLDLSSRDLRERATRNQNLRYRTPRAVEQYIAANQLYHQLD
jgi:nicotinate-nucleotide adenylyltransferase